jgi:hypothetical protein
MILFNTLERDTKMFQTSANSLIRRFLRHSIVVVAVIFSALALPSHAASYQDIWYTPGEEGWGLNITQQGDVLFASWFVQGQDQAPTWFSAAASKTGANTYSGSLNITRGAWFGGAWNPAAVSTTATGTATFTFNDKKSLRLVYSSGGTTVTKTLTRFTFAAQNLSGDFYGAELGTPTNCTNNGKYFAFSLFSIAASFAPNSNGGPIKITQETAGATGSTFCTLSGNFVQYGTAIEASGNYTCTTGTSGTWRATDGQFSDEAFSMKVVANSGSCQIDATYTGARS